MRRNVASCVATSAVLLAVTMLVSPARGAEREDAYERERAAWVAAGHPTDPQEMLPQRVASRDNAVTYYLRAEKRVEQLPADTMQALLEPWHSDLLGDLSERLEPILDVIEEGRACEACVWSIDVDDPRELFASSVAYGAAMRAIARTYHAGILSAGANGRPAEAMRLVEQGLDVAADLGTAPTAYNLILKDTIQQSTLNAYRRVFADAALPRNEVGRWLEETDIEREFTRAAELEVAAWTTAYETGFFGELLTDPQKEQAARAELAWLLKMTRRGLAGEAEAVQATVVDTRPAPRVLFTEEWPPMPWFPLLHTKTYQSRLLVSRLGVELREYKAEHGEYPATFDTPIDPLTGEPYVYEKTATGCVVATRSKYPIEWRWE